MAQKSVEFAIGARSPGGTPLFGFFTPGEQKKAPSPLSTARSDEQRDAGRAIEDTTGFVEGGKHA
jgi:hypothetical protein